MFQSLEQQHNHYLEPPEPKIFAYDWRGDEIYYGDKYYEIDGDFILENDLERYAEGIVDKYGGLVTTLIPDDGEDEPIVFTYDWRGYEIYAGDSYYYLNGDCILEDDLEDYAKEMLVSELMIAGE